MTETFKNWTAYDEWLVLHYNDVTVEKLEENPDKSVTATYQEKNSNR